MKDKFSTIEITKLTPEERVFQFVGENARPGKMCELKPGFILEHELEDIAKHLNVTLDQLKENLLHEVYAYNKKLHKPKHSKKIARTGDKITDAFHKLPYGECVFLDKDSKEHRCRIEGAKPLHCRLATQNGVAEKIHSWFLLNHVVNEDDPHSIREWAIYLKTHPTIPGGELHELVSDKEKLSKILSDDFHKNFGNQEKKH